jgi:hypothetical protein
MPRRKIKSSSIPVTNSNFWAALQVQDGEVIDTWRRRVFKDTSKMRHILSQLNNSCKYPSYEIDHIPSMIQMFRSVEHRQCTGIDWHRLGDILKYIFINKMVTQHFQNRQWWLMTKQFVIAKPSKIKH